MINALHIPNQYNESNSQSYTSQNDAYGSRNYHTYNNDYNDAPSLEAWGIIAIMVYVMVVLCIVGFGVNNEKQIYKKPKVNGTKTQPLIVPVNTPVSEKLTQLNQNNKYIFDLFRAKNNKENLE